MKVLLIGSGGREHALAWKLAQSPLLTTLYCAPGNAGIAEEAHIVDLAIEDAAAVAQFCRSQGIDFVVVGPEAPLVAGLADVIAAAGIPVFGPSRAAAQLEGSKAFTKAVCDARGIPTAKYRVFDGGQGALDFARALGGAVVVKADGLAAGKGVTVCDSLPQAEEAIRACFDGAFGESGARVVIEEKLVGKEMSFFALCDGRTALPFGTARDYKRALDGDRGPNTGGMGAISPAREESAELEREIMSRFIAPTLEEMASRGAPFCGVLYAGLMLTADGPKLIEYNVRFGDPECQLLMLRLKSDLLALLKAAASGELHQVTAEWSSEDAVLVVMASNGYPGSYKTGSVIEGLADAAAVPGARVFHAGTRRSASGEVVSSGGRVLNICASAPRARKARNLAYEAAGRIRWPEGFYRHDIAADELGAEAGAPDD